MFFQLAGGSGHKFYNHNGASGDLTLAQNTVVVYEKNDGTLESIVPATGDILVADSTAGQFRKIRQITIHNPAAGGTTRTFAMRATFHANPPYIVSFDIPAGKTLCYTKEAGFFMMGAAAPEGTGGGHGNLPDPI